MRRCIALAVLSTASLMRLAYEQISDFFGFIRVRSLWTEPFFLIYGTFPVQFNYYFVLR